MCILLHGLARNALVLDPFMGIGSAAVACPDLGRDFVGFEIDRHYFAEAIKRIRVERGCFDFPGDPSDLASQAPLGGKGRKNG